MRTVTEIRKQALLATLGIIKTNYGKTPPEGGTHVALSGFPDPYDFRKEAAASFEWWDFTQRRWRNDIAIQDAKHTIIAPLSLLNFSDGR